MSASLTTRSLTKLSGMSLPPSLSQKLKEKLKRNVKQSLTDWAVCALAPFNQVPAAHHRLLIDKLEKVERKEIMRLMIWMPPGSAKSTYASVLFPAWYMARNINKNVLAASHTSGLAEGFSKRVNDLVVEHADLLGYTTANSAVERWYTSNGCQYKCTGVGGGIAGFRSDLCIIDDPVRTRKDADSKTYRDTAYNWYKADVFPRLKPKAPVVIIQTRWHEDDLSGRLIQDDREGWEVIKLPALAEADDPLGRAIGVPLGTDDDYGYDDQLLLALREQGQRDWWSLYQQSPRPVSGGIFNVAKVEIVEAAPARMQLVRAWDLASTKETGGRDPDWTVGLLLGRTPEAAYVVSDVVRVRGGPDEVEKTIKATASRDGKRVLISLPQDPGQAGKAQAQYLTRKLSGYMVHTSTETGDKATRAMPFASQVNVGNVSLVSADWNRTMTEEMAGFPSMAHDDIVDAASRAFERLSGAGGALERAKALVQ